MAEKMPEAWRLRRDAPMLTGQERRVLEIAAGLHGDGTVTLSGHLIHAAKTLARHRFLDETCAESPKDTTYTITEAGSRALAESFDPRRLLIACDHLEQAGFAAEVAILRWLVKNNYRSQLFEEDNR
jgi:DNA-binding PadR family transcriptional regulator